MDEKQTDKVIFAGQPYLTKINGKLVMVRKKQDKTVRKRTKSLDLAIPTPITSGSSCLAQQSPIFTPVLHHSFSPDLIQNAQLQPIVRYPTVPPGPTQGDLDLLKCIDADYRRRCMEESLQNTLILQKNREEPQERTKTTISMTLHICAKCQRLRSRKYQYEHPIRPGEVPAPRLCRKCQRDDSPTNNSQSKKRVHGDRRKHRQVLIPSLNIG